MAKKAEAPAASAATFASVGAPLDVISRFLACDHKTIQNYAKKNLVIRLGHGRYALMQSVANVVTYLREQAAGRLGKSENIDAARANASLKNAQEELTRLRIKQLQGETISLPEIRSAWGEIALNAKQMILSIPSRARFRLTHLTGADQDGLDEIVREVLDELAFVELEPIVPEKGNGRDNATQEADE